MDKPIPEGALQAARVAYGSSMPDEERMRAALAAAVPHLTAAQQQGQATALKARVCGYTPGMSRVNMQFEPMPIPEWLEIGEEVFVSSQQPEARVYQCPRCATSMEVDPTAKPEARGVVDEGSRIVTSQLLHWGGIPVYVTGTVTTSPGNWPLIDAALTEARNVR